ncbi:ribosome small subunit-dependent GTPase A, partial [Francisella tularensis subsp. holarctica]|nr:ribosome small subunit-dependent GTPase A [Francisella tularensis subsp. holarctica]
SHEEGSKGCEIVRQVSLSNINPVSFKNYHRILAEIKNN